MQVICDLPNASESINGVSFTRVGADWVSEEIPPEQAEHFLRIPGYRPIDAPSRPAPRKPRGAERDAE